MTAHPIDPTATPRVRRTATRLADGRELIYFDDSEPYLTGGATRRLDDPRPLPDRFADVVGDDGTRHPVTAPEMRYDVLTGEWVPMAAHRMNRTHLPPANANPLAPARPGAAYSDGEVPAADYGSESGMGAWISDTTPERIADRYREVMPDVAAEPAG